MRASCERSAAAMASLPWHMTAARRPLTVSTNSAASIETLMDQAGITLIALGGIYSAKFNAYLGKITEDALGALRADLAFISTPAVAGMETFHMDEAVLRSKRLMMDAALSSCLLATHTRFGHTALHKLADLSEFDHIITDKAPEPEARAALDWAGLSLTIADGTQADP